MSDCPNQISCCDNESSFIYSIVDYPVYRNEEITIFVPCPVGFVCSVPGIYVTIPAGTIEYRPTDDEENGGGSGSGGGGFGGGSTPGTGGSGSTPQQTVNQMANDAAIRRGNASLRPEPTVYFNNVATAVCAAGGIGGLPSTNSLYDPATGGAIMMPGLVSSTVSQADAQARAQFIVNAAIEIYGDCHWLNTEQTYTAYCELDGEKFYGPPVTKTVPAGTYTSDASQEDANNQAMEDAQQQAIDALVCYDFQNVEYTATCPEGEVGDPVTKAAGLFFSNISQADADLQAQVAAEADLECQSECAVTEIQDLVWVHSGDGSGSITGTSGSISVDGTSGQSALQAFITNDCPDAFTVKIAVSSMLATNDTGVVSKMEIFIAGVQQAISELSLPGAGPTCYFKNEPIQAQVVVNPGATIELTIAAYQQTDSGCAGADGTITISIL